MVMIVMVVMIVLRFACAARRARLGALDGRRAHKRIGGQHHAAPDAFTGLGMARERRILDRLLQLVTPRRFSGTRQGFVDVGDHLENGVRQSAWRQIGKWETESETHLRALERACIRRRRLLRAGADRFGHRRGCKEPLIGVQMTRGSGRDDLLFVVLAGERDDGDFRHVAELFHEGNLIQVRGAMRDDGVELLRLRDSQRRLGIPARLHRGIGKPAMQRGREQQQPLRILSYDQETTGEQHGSGLRHGVAETPQCVEDVPGFRLNRLKLRSRGMSVSVW